LFKSSCNSLCSFIEDLLSNGGRGTSCDSLLEPSQGCKLRSVTVQRAISEPSKKFTNFREIEIHKPKLLSRRAISDEQVDDHDYINIAAVHDALDKNAAISPKVRVTVGSDHGSPPDRYSFVHGSSPGSMETLLSDYTPPPQYNELHARQRDAMIARQLSQGSTSSLLQPPNESLLATRCVTPTGQGIILVRPTPLITTTTPRIASKPTRSASSCQTTEPKHLVHRKTESNEETTSYRSPVSVILHFCLNSGISRNMLVT